MKEFKRYLDKVIALKEKYILTYRKTLISTFIGAPIGEPISEYERQMIILKEYKDLRKVIDL